MARGGRLRLVVVDDDADQRELMGEVLMLAGHHVSEFGAAVEALAFCKGAPPDVVVMDLGLPGIGGIDAIRQLRQWPHTRVVPIVAVTAYRGPSILDEAARAGVSAILLKPCTSIRLVQVVQLAARSPGKGGVIRG